jgi:hypothetical protein
MKKYDPDKTVRSSDWLQTDEGERIELVRSYHRHRNIRLPNERLHAVIHVIIENQLALSEAGVVETLARLQAEGLGRHDALHAIGSVLADYVYALMQDEAEEVREPYHRYLEDLKTLTASNWRRG